MGSSLPKSLRSFYPFQSRYISLSSGARLHYIDEGRENLTLFLHDIPLWSFYFRNLIRKLRERFRCLAPDYLGFGLSDKPGGVRYSLRSITANVIELLTQLNVGKFNLVLHGWGAVPGMVIATRWPERVNRIVLLNANVFPEFTIPPSFPVYRMSFLGRIAINLLNLPARGAAFSAKIGSYSRSGYLFPYRGWSSRNPTRIFIKNLPLSPAEGDGKWLNGIAEKIFILTHKKSMAFWGLRDNMFTENTLDRWGRDFEEMKTHTFADGGRHALEDEFEVIFPLLRRFLAEGIEAKLPL